MGRKKDAPNRPLAPINWAKVDTMMLAGAPGTEIAGSIGIHPDSFYRRYKKEYGIGFTDAIYSKKQGGYANVRARQYVSAMNGNTQMLKILGEEWLGQGKSSDESGTTEARDLIAYREKIEKLEAALLTRGISISDISPEQPVSHQGCSGEESKVPDELGTTDTMGAETQL